MQLSKMTSEELKALKHYYNNVFSTAEGRIVLRHILTKCRCFSTKATGEDVIHLRNFGTELMSMVGGNDADTQTQAVVDALLFTGGPKAREEGNAKKEEKG